MPFNITRTHIPILLALLCLAATSSSHPVVAQDAPGVQYLPAKQMTLYIGTYTHSPQEGICLSHFDPESGELSPAQTVAPTSNPSFLATSKDGRFLYAVNEWGQLAGENKGGLSAFRIEPQTQALTPLGAHSVGGTLCHLALDATGKWLLATAYSAGTISTWPLQGDGSIGERVALTQHTGSGPNQNRQQEPHAHHIVLSPDNRRAFVADLGIDKVTIDNFDATTGELSANAAPFVPLAPGAGPRHLALSSSGQFLYVLSELDNSITVFKNAQNTPQQIQSVSTLPADFDAQSAGAEIAIRPDGRFLYASNRGHNSIVCYSIAPDGQLKWVGFSPTGRNPRHFTFDPTGKWLLAANQSDRSISVFSVDAETGVLTEKHKLNDIPGDPVCLLFSSQQ